jgi:hypothetical protein
MTASESPPIGGQEAKLPPPLAGAEAGFREPQLRAAGVGRACQRATLLEWGRSLRYLSRQGR